MPVNIHCLQAVLVSAVEWVSVFKCIPAFEAGISIGFYGADLYKTVTGVSFYFKMIGIAFFGGSPLKQVKAIGFGSSKSRQLYRQGCCRRGNIKPAKAGNIKGYFPSC